MQEQEQDNPGSQPTGREVKYRILEKGDALGALIEEDTCRPHAVHVQHNRKIVLDHRRNLFVDVRQELGLYVFLWPEDGEQKHDALFLSELSKFKDLCDLTLKQLVYQLSAIKHLPLANRVKTKP